MEGWEAKSCAPSFLSASGRQEPRWSGGCARAELLENLNVREVLLSPVLYVLEMLFSLLASEQRLVPELVAQVEVVSVHLWCSFLPLWPHPGDHVAIRAAEEIPRMFLVPMASVDPWRDHHMAKFKAATLVLVRIFNFTCASCLTKVNGLLACVKLGMC